VAGGGGGRCRVFSRGSAGCGSCSRRRHDSAGGHGVPDGGDGGGRSPQRACRCSHDSSPPARRASSWKPCRLTSARRRPPAAFGRGDWAACERRWRRGSGERRRRGDGLSAPRIGRGCCGTSSLWRGGRWRWRGKWPPVERHVPRVGQKSTRGRCRRQQRRWWCGRRGASESPHARCRRRLRRRLQRPGCGHGRHPVGCVARGGTRQGRLERPGWAACGRWTTSDPRAPTRACARWWCRRRQWRRRGGV
jgi:hypothetical protein